MCLAGVGIDALCGSRLAVESALAPFGVLVVTRALGVFCLPVIAYFFERVLSEPNADRVFLRAQSSPVCTSEYRVAVRVEEVLQPLRFTRRRCYAIARFERGFDDRSTQTARISRHEPHLGRRGSYRTAAHDATLKGPLDNPPGEGTRPHAEIAFSRGA